MLVFSDVLEPFQKVDVLSTGFADCLGSGISIEGSAPESLSLTPGPHFCPEACRSEIPEKQGAVPRIADDVCCLLGVSEVQSILCRSLEESVSAQAFQFGTSVLSDSITACSFFVSWS